MATAKGKITAARLRPGQRIQVVLFGERGVRESYTKVKGATSALVRNVDEAYNGRRVGRQVVVEVDGEIRSMIVSANQTFWLSREG